MAARVEEQGYDSAWVGEFWGESAVVQLAEAAAATESITLGSAVLNVFSRSPATLAMTAASLDRVADGRFRLGTGTSTAALVEDLHGEQFHRPVRRAHETIALVDRFLGDGDAVEFDGELLTASGFDPLSVDVPVYHAAMGKANRRVVARLCDGWLPHLFPLSELPAAFEYVADVAAEAGRDPAAISVAPFVPVAASPDPDAARAVLREHVSYYVGVSDSYRRAVATAFPDATDEVTERWRGGDRDAAAAVTREMLDDLGVAGTPETVRRRVEELAERSVVDELLVGTPPSMSTEAAVETVAAVAPDG